MCNLQFLKYRFFLFSRIKRVAIYQVVCSFFLLHMTTSVSANVINGIKLEPSIKLSDDLLLLNGAGVRSMFLINLYVGSLYVKDKTTDSFSVIEGDSPVIIRLNFMSRVISPSRLLKVIDRAFIKATNDHTKPLQQRIDKMITVFKEPILPFDQFTFVVPPNGVIIKKNTKQVVLIKGVDFRRVLLKIWLGENPVDESLKKAMLNVN